MTLHTTIAPELTSARLRLRAPEARDIETYAAFFADAEASAFYGGPLRRDQAFRALGWHLGHWLLKGTGMFMVEHEGKTLGGCGIVHPDGWPSHELTWWLLPEGRGKGIAEEASRLVLDWAGRALGMTGVETHFNDNNTAARRLTERLGGSKIRRDSFPDGVTRDVYLIPTASVLRGISTSPEIMGEQP